MVKRGQNVWNLPIAILYCPHLLPFISLLREVSRSGASPFLSMLSCHLSSHCSAVNHLLHLWIHSLACHCLLYSESYVIISQWHHDWHLPESKLCHRNTLLTDIQAQPQTKTPIVVTTDSLLFQIQMSEHNLLPCGGELHDNLFLILSQLSSTFSYHLGN